MNHEKHTVYEFGGFELDPAREKLLRDGEPVVLAHKVFETLVVLVQNAGRVLEKEELIQALWPESFVEEGNLSQNIFLLRKLLGDDRNGHSFIHTIPRKGYKFIASVTEREATALAPVPAVAEFWRQHSPFRSLRAFEPEDAWLFFGRDAEVDDLVIRLARAPVLAMVGNSGSGKSSLLRAGLIPALRAGRCCGEGTSAELLSADSWRVALLRPSAAPFDYLAEALPSQLAPELDASDQAEFIAGWRSRLSVGGCALRNAVHALVLAAMKKTGQAETGANGRGRVLLVVDQFEEIFTLTAKQEVRDRYIDGLLAAASMDGEVPVQVVLAMRADFYGHCLEHAGLSRSLETNLYNVPRMTPEQMRETIEKRLQLAGARAEPGLIDALLEDAGEEPGNLALLEHALGQLWEECGGPGCAFTNHAYTRIGRLRGALGRHADEVFQGLGDDEQKRLAQRVFLELVHLGEGAQDTRRRVAKAELLGLGEPAHVENLLARLASSRLIATGREGEQTFVEVSHEALIREWPALREWISQNREELALERRLTQAAEEWRGLQRDPGALLQGARLAQAEDWLSRHRDAPDVVSEYVQASIESRTESARKKREVQERELDQQKATARRFRWFSYVLAVASVVAVGSAWFAYHQSVLEKSWAMAAQAEELTSRDHGQALELAIRSWQIAKTDEARIAVAKTFPEQLVILRHGGPVTVLGFWPDGRRVLTAGSDHTARIWDVDSGRLLATLQGHTAQIEDADISPDGQLIVTTSDDKTVRLWNPDSGRLIFTLRGHSDRVRRVWFSPDGQRIVTASDDHAARVWSTDGHVLAILRGHTGIVATARFSPDEQRIVTASWDHTARVWNSADGRLLATLQHDSEVNYAAFSPDNQRIVTGTFNNAALVWNSADGRLLFKLQHAGAVPSAMFSPDGQRILTASYDNTARLWNSIDGRLLFTFQHRGPVSYAEFSADGRHIVTASFDHTARVWNVADGLLLAVLEGHTDQVLNAALSHDGRRIVTGGADQTARVWNTATGVSLLTLQGHTSYLSFARFVSDSSRVITASYDHTARVWNAHDGRTIVTLRGHTAEVWNARFSPDCQRIVTASKDGTARVWNAADGRSLFVLKGHTDQVSQAIFSPDGQRIVTASKDGTARVWNAADGRSLLVLKGHTDEVSQAIFSPDGQRIVTASKDGTARVWSTADGQLLFILGGHTDQVAAVFSTDGQRIVTASKDGTVRVWAAVDGRLLLTFAFTFQGDHLAQEAVSPDGERIAMPSSGNAAQVWNIADGRLIATLQGHTDKVRSIAFAPEGKRIVTASKDNTARVWDVDGRLLATLQGHTYMVGPAEFSPDGRRIVTASADQTARVWQILTLDDIERILTK